MQQQTWCAQWRKCKFNEEMLLIFDLNIKAPCALVPPLKWEALGLCISLVVDNKGPMWKPTTRPVGLNLLRWWSNIKLIWFIYKVVYYVLLERVTIRRAIIETSSRSGNSPFYLRHNFGTIRMFLIRTCMQSEREFQVNGNLPVLYMVIKLYDPTKRKEKVCIRLSAFYLQLKNLWAF